MARIKVAFAPSVRRLPSYLQIVKQAQLSGQSHISGTLIAAELELEPIQVRKDLAITGVAGKPKKGYPVHALVEAIEGYLGWNELHEAVLVGAGNLGSAFIGYREFPLHGLHVGAAFDADPAKIGSTIHGLTILPMEDLDESIRRLKAEIAILTVPPAAAQGIVDGLVRAGITSIWNFTNIKLRVPESVVVQYEDLSMGYALLSAMMQKRKGRIEG